MPCCVRGATADASGPDGTATGTQNSSQCLYSLAVETSMFRWTEQGLPMQSGGVALPPPERCNTRCATPIRRAARGSVESDDDLVLRPAPSPVAGRISASELPEQSRIGHWACGYSRCTATRERRCTGVTSSKGLGSTSGEEHSHRGLGGLGLPRGQPGVTMQVSRWSQGVKRPGKTPNQASSGVLPCGHHASCHHDRSWQPRRQMQLRSHSGMCGRTGEIHGMSVCLRGTVWPWLYVPTRPGSASSSTHRMPANSRTSTSDCWAGRSA